MPTTDTPPAAEPAGGPWTRHGHPIPGVTVAGSGRPLIARCGGPALCRKCREDVEQARDAAAADRPLTDLTPAEVLQVALEESTAEQRRDEAWVTALAALVRAARDQGESDSEHVTECLERLRATEPTVYASAWVDMSDLHVALAEMEQLRARVAELERRDDLARRAGQLWADAWRHRHDAPDDEQAERGDQLEAALDAVAAAHGIEVQR